MGLYVRHLTVHGLHRRLDFELTLQEDINILFGRNGSGKTTLLHILANVLNGSFERFAYLDFDSVQVGVSDGKELTIYRRHGTTEDRDSIEILANGISVVPPFAVEAVRTSSIGRPVRRKNQLQLPDPFSG